MMDIKISDHSTKRSLKFCQHSSQHNESLVLMDACDSPPCSFCNIIVNGNDVLLGRN
jgi:hypothetical protein